MNAHRFVRRSDRIPQGSRSSRRRAVRPALEALDERCLLSLYMVDTLMDNGNNNAPTNGSLRQCIIEANSHPGSTINFSSNLPTGYLHIMLASELPAVTADSTTIQGPSVTELAIDGENVGGVTGLTLEGNHDVVSGLGVVHCGGSGILVLGQDDVISFCSIGTDTISDPGLGDGTGVAVLGAQGLAITECSVKFNARTGVLVLGSADITISGDDVEHNSADGVRVIGNGTDNGEGFVTLIDDDDVDENEGNGVHIINSSNNNIGSAQFGNFIGDDGLQANFQGNVADGVLIESTGGGTSTGNIIRNNSIAGNHQNGVALVGAGTSNNTLWNNVIGITSYTPEDTNILEPLAAGNMLDGVAISGGSHDNSVGGVGLYGGDGLYALSSVSFEGQGNLIIASGGAGVRITDPGSDQNFVQGNIIGTGLTIKGYTYPPNGGGGVVIANGASQNLIGGVGGTAIYFGQGNLISGNTGDGLEITGTGTSDNTVYGNLIGTDLKGTNALPNTGAGVVIQDGASANTLGLYTGGSSLHIGNTISGNDGVGVDIVGVGTTGNAVYNNNIGTDISGLTSVPNVNGVEVTGGAAGNIIGGPSTDQGNVISGNFGAGVVIGASSGACLVQNNDVGTSWSGLAGLGNAVNGVELLGNGSQLVHNVISANGFGGVVVNGSDNVLQGNTIGTSKGGMTALPNLGDGVYIRVTQGSGSNSVGGTTSSEGNQISGNAGNGIHVTGPSSTGNLIAGNKIGTNANGESRVSNGLDGILIEDSSGYVIGGTTPQAGNVISGNLENGIALTGFGTTGILVLGNTIGTDAKGVKSIGNGQNGVAILSAPYNAIGDGVQGAGNLISGNLADGVLIRGTPIGVFNQATGNRVLGNRIGTSASGMAKVPNLGQGVEINLAYDNVIGGVLPAGAET